MEPLAVMTSMDAEMGLKLMDVLEPDLVVPVHCDDYDGFTSGIEEFGRLVVAASVKERVVFIGRGEVLRFWVGR
jgi:L-ascorbate metabolism protein UlaG (beta-lactamase superfamily)